MSSAQVQRTLVKSPPELWAELSDPAALARHLGELGEIRITRVEPEHKVEWAAEHARGTVRIKPSAWGTRVTLTASREQGGDPPSSPTDVPSLRTSVKPTPPARTAAAPPLSGVQPDVEAAIAAVCTPDEPVSGAEPPTPASETPIAAGHDPATAAEQLSSAAEERDSASDSRQASTPALAAQQPIATERALEPCSTEPEPASERRRGLFARLLRRLGREQPAEASARAAPPAPRSVAAFAQGSATEPAQDEPAARAAAAPSPRAAESPGQPAADAAKPPTAKAHEPSLGAAPPMPLDQHKPLPEDPPMAPGAGAPEPGPVAVPAQSATGEPPSQQPRAPQPEVPTAPRAASGDGPVDDVTAVLNSVLDRLGAAHHRPFSRA